MEDIEKLEDFERTRGKLRLPAELKPCIANLIENPAFIDGLKPFIIGCELQRIGTTEKKIEALLTRVNVKPSKIRAIIQSLTSGKYSYGCPKLEEMGLCLYKTRFECWWYNKIPRQSQKEWREQDFWRYNWPQRLRPTVSMLYLAIKAIEKKRRIWAGSWLFISWNEFVEKSGVNRKTVKVGLTRLHQIGLIEYKPGQRRIKGSRGLATQVKRVIPIPKPK